MDVTIRNSLLFGGGAFKPYSAVHSSPEHNLTATSAELRTNFSAGSSSTNDSGCSRKGSPANETLSKDEDPKVLPKEDEQPTKTAKEEKQMGRWSEEEHRRFIEAMEIYGNVWTLVKNHIKTRTTAQIRSHAQKYYTGLRKKAIKKCKEDPKNAKAIFVVVREYLNMSTFRQVNMQKSKRKQ